MPESSRFSRFCDLLLLLTFVLTVITGASVALTRVQDRQHQGSHHGLGSSFARISLGVPHRL